MVASVRIVVCVYMATPTGRGGGSLSWQRVPLSRLALPVNRDSEVISIIMHCTSWLTGHARRDNGTHCQDNALLPPRWGGVAVYYLLIKSRWLKYAQQTRHVAKLQLRLMSHLQFYRATLQRNFIARPICSVQLLMLHTAINDMNKPNNRGFLWLWWR